MLAQSCGIFRLHFCNMKAWSLNRANWLAYLCSNCFLLSMKCLGVDVFPMCLFLAHVLSPEPKSKASEMLHFKMLTFMPCNMKLIVLLTPSELQKVQLS